MGVKKLALGAALVFATMFNAAAQSPQNAAPAETSVTPAKDSVKTTADADGHVVSREHYNARGELNDMPDGTPAYRQYNSHSTLIATERYRDGVLNDADDGAAAVVAYNDAGKIASEERYRNDQLTDGIYGDPAKLVFADDGKLLIAIRYSYGTPVKVLSADERNAYMSQRGQSASLRSGTSSDETKKGGIFHRRRKA